MMGSDRHSSSSADVEDDAATTHDCLPGRIGARYEVVERLGRGGMAVVYRVRDRSRPDELFALKQLILSGSARNAETRALFEREFCVLAQLHHPGVVEVYDFGVDAAGPYYTMELLDSGDLAARAPWPFAEACELMMQVCSSLSLLHSRRLVHRDVSPRNVRCTRHGAAKLIDFGAMVPMGPCAQGVGTPGFIAPEVLHHLALDARTDLFSLGATLYHALTGNRPFAARTLAELGEAWRHEPAPPSSIVPGIPPALDALVLSLLRLDPARRPSSAFEVMQRLAAIADKPLVESAEIARAYLSTPVLVGREVQQRRFRRALRRAMHGDGSGLLFEAASGLGRSRLLDACVLEAKTSGATVLRLAGRAARPEAFASAHRLAEQLLEALPDEARAGTADPEVLSRLFCAADDAVPNQPAPVGPLRSLESMGEDSYAVQGALLTWLRRVSREQPLVIAVDDIERIDDRSLALLVALVHGAGDARLLVVSSTQSPIDLVRQPALAVMRTHCTAMTLAPLTAAETEELFGSIFFGAPYAGLVSDRIHKLAAGNPREALALAQHMLDERLIRFADGNWVLPAELAVSDLPASAEEALRLQLSSLAELPRLLAETQALALEGPWSRKDYGVIAAASGAERVDAAIASLLRQGVIVNDAGAYTLSHLGVRSCLVSQLTPAERVRHELALAELCAKTGRPGLVEVYHLLQGKSFEPGLEQLALLLNEASTVQSLYKQSRVDIKIIAQIIEHAHELSIACGRKARERHELARLLLEVSVATDSKLFHRHAADRLAQLERDSGLVDYRAAVDMSAPQRLQHALESAAARYRNSPEAQRVYRVDEAIKQLATYVAVSIAIAARTLDTKLLASLSGLLEPFSVLSPVLYALCQNAIAAKETLCEGRLEQAHTRWLDVYQRLEQAARGDLGGDLAHLDVVRRAVAYGAASLEVMLGYPSAEHWISIIEEDPLQRVAAQYLRRALSILDGDAAGAERYQKQAELLGVQAVTRQLFERPVSLELSLQVHAADLAGVKHAADRIAKMASESPGWLAYHHVAQACFHQLRGDLHAAKAAVERALALAVPEQTDPPPNLNAWMSAAAVYITVLTDLGQLEDARTFGREACERCEAQAVSGFYGHVRALALAEAKLGDHAAASARLDKLIAQRAHLRPSQLALDFEARARVAIWAKDAAGAGHFAQLATNDTAADGGVRSRARRRRLLDEAQQAGLRIDTPPSDFESTLLGTLRPGRPSIMLPKVTDALDPLHDAAARAQRALELLCEALEAPSGQLYYANSTQLQHTAGLGPHDAALDRFVHRYWRQRLDQAAVSTVFTAPESDAGALATASWTSPTGKRYCIIPLSPGAEAECVGLVALLVRRSDVPSAEYWALSASISTRLLAVGDVAAAS
jgi:hypothetical protein